MITSFQDIFTNVDYALLKKQSDTLLEIFDGKELNVEQKEAIEGITNFIDAFRDAAVDFGIEEKKVFS